MNNKDAILIFPHQLFKDSPLLNLDGDLYLGTGKAYEAFSNGGAETRGEEEEGFDKDRWSGKWEGVWIRAAEKGLEAAEEEANAREDALDLGGGKRRKIDPEMTPDQ